MVELDAGDGDPEQPEREGGGVAVGNGSRCAGGVSGVVIVMVSSGGVGELAMCPQCDTAARSAVISAISSCWSESSSS